MSSMLLTIVRGHAKQTTQIIVRLSSIETGHQIYALSTSHDGITSGTEAIRVAQLCCTSGCTHRILYVLLCQHGCLLHTPVFIEIQMPCILNVWVSTHCHRLCKSILTCPALLALGFSLPSLIVHTEAPQLHCYLCCEGRPTASRDSLRTALSSVCRSAAAAKHCCSVFALAAAEPPLFSNPGQPCAMRTPMAAHSHNSEQTRSDR